MRTRFVKVTPEEAFEQLNKDISKLYVYQGGKLVPACESGRGVTSFLVLRWFILEGEE